ncbi:uncharacterized protein METZ01_LOCUS169179 [marine metagenome]|uniref:Uncharacterized protein n=1 Tax=marine metagenome TaxID=408172 RepID=A0A382BR99_9ZZZZ
MKKNDNNLTPLALLVYNPRGFLENYPAKYL